MAVLILSHEHDSTAHRVQQHIEHLGGQAVLLNPAAFPQRISLSARVRETTPWQGTIQTTHGPLPFDAITSVYVRRPHHYHIREGYPETVERFLENEAMKGFGGILRSLSCLWMNDLEAIRRASFQPFQLTLAASLGWHLPDTLITNDPEAFLAFWQQQEGRVIYKPLHGNFFPGGGHTYYTIYTSLVGEELLSQREGIRETAHLFQADIPKCYEIRATVIGETVLAVGIDSQRAHASRQDWRASYQDLRYWVEPLPREVEQRCIALTQALGLLYGALDLIVTPSGDFIFLEINPNGQYGWLETETGLPFSRTIATVLLRGGNSA